MLTNEEISDAFSALRREYYRAEPLLLAEMRIKNTLDRKEMELLAAEAITGGNAETRGAKLKQATIELHDALDEARVAILNSNTRIKAITQEIESIKWQIRNTENILRGTEMRREAKKDG